MMAMREVVDGVFEIAVGFVNAHLVVVDDGVVLVDTGLPKRTATIEQALQDDPSARAAQRRLADEVTRTVHGDAALTGVRSDAALRFGGAVSAEALQQVAPSASVSLAKIKAGLPTTEM